MQHGVARRAAGALHSFTFQLDVTHLEWDTLRGVSASVIMKRLRLSWKVDECNAPGVRCETDTDCASVGTNMARFRVY